MNREYFSGRSTVYFSTRNWFESIVVLCRKASLSTDNEATMRRNCAKRRYGCSLVKLAAKEQVIVQAVSLQSRHSNLIGIGFPITHYGNWNKATVSRKNVFEVGCSTDVPLLLFFFFSCPFYRFHSSLRTSKVDQKFILNFHVYYNWSECGINTFVRVKYAKDY